MLKKFPSDKITGTKNAFFFLSRAPTHHSFTFNLRFLYELKHKVRLSKTVCGTFHFRFHYDLELPKSDLVTNFLNLENRSFENVSFSPQ